MPKRKKLYYCTTPFCTFTCDNGVAISNHQCKYCTESKICHDTATLNQHMQQHNNHEAVGPGEDILLDIANKNSATDINKNTIQKCNQSIWMMKMIAMRGNPQMMNLQKGAHISVMMVTSNVPLFHFDEYDATEYKYESIGEQSHGTNAMEREFICNYSKCTDGDIWEVPDEAMGTREAINFGEVHNRIIVNTEM